jgi:hypothetical protein
MGATYTDNQVPIGSIVASITSAPPSTAVVISNAVFDDVSLNLPGRVIERSDEVGKDNGWALIATTITAGLPVTGSATIQVPTATASNQLGGKSFAYAFDGSSTATSKFVITETGIPFAKDGYFKVTCQFRLSRTPATA